MSRGIVLLTDTQKAFKNHRILLGTKSPFQKMEENYFIKPKQYRWEISKQLMDELMVLKSMKRNSDRVSHILMTGFMIFAIALIGSTFIG